MGQRGARVGCFPLLVASCACFQPRFPLVTRRFGNHGPRTSPSSSSPPEGRTSSRQSQAFNLIPLDPVSSPPGDTRNDTTTPAKTTSMTTSSTTNGLFYKEELTRNDPYPLGISKHYFEEMEERSGKDYRWIKPLTQPVSQLML